MISHELALLALEPIPSNDWIVRSLEILVGAGFNSFQRGNRLFVLDEMNRVGSCKYADGYSLQRMWLAPRRNAISILAKRIYFCADGKTPDHRAEHEVLSGIKRPQAPFAEEYVAKQHLILDLLIKGFRRSINFVPIDQLEIDLCEFRTVHIETTDHQSPPNSLNQIYREYGFDNVPLDFTISICPVDTVQDTAARQFKTRLEQVAQRRGSELTVKIVTRNAVVNRIRQLDELGQSALSGHSLLLLLPQKNCPIRNETLSLISSLESANVPFRRAYQDDPHEFSIPDQFPSLLIASGGIPHRSRMVVNNHSVWTIGVDLSHGLDSDTSRLALTLVNPDGQLVGTWDTQQPRDETARATSLSILLKECKKRLYDFDPTPHVVVLRDGRLFENEDHELYREEIGVKLSLFEYRKRNTPQIIQQSSPQTSIRLPTAALVPNENTILIATSPPRNDRAPLSIAKVTWKSAWNGLGLTAKQISKLLTISASSPGLGLHSRHLPAAIYWADGIAGRNRNDLRFYGVPVKTLPEAE